MQRLLKDACRLNRFSGSPLQTKQFHYCRSRVFPPGHSMIPHTFRLEAVAGN